MKTCRVCSGCRIAGLVNGDELMVIDGHVVADLDITYIESLLHSCTTLCCTVRSCYPAMFSRQLQPTAKLPGMRITCRTDLAEYMDWSLFMLKQKQTPEYGHCGTKQCCRHILMKATKHLISCFASLAEHMYRFVPIQECWKYDKGKCTTGQWNKSCGSENTRPEKTALRYSCEGGKCETWKCRLVNRKRDLCHFEFELSCVGLSASQLTASLGVQFSSVRS